MSPEPSDELNENDLKAQAREHGKAPLDHLNEKVLNQIRRERVKERENELSELLDELEQEPENDSPDFDQ